MAQEEASDVSGSCVGDAGGTVMRVAEVGSSAADGANACVALPASVSASSESCKYVTAGMSKVEISGMIETSREQGWSELADRVHDGAGPADSSHAFHYVQRAIWKGLKKMDPRVFRDHYVQRRSWKELKKKDPLVFVDPGSLKLGRLIAEGGQAQIYEARRDISEGWDRVAKVFKMEGFSLADLQRHWPVATRMPPTSPSTLDAPTESQSRRFACNFLLGGVVFGEIMVGCSLIYSGTILEDGRFAFVMPRYWGDLRTLINLKLKDNHSRGPPFSLPRALRSMSDIAWGMKELHERGVLHRDLKAANVLIRVLGDPRDDGSSFACDVADYECAMMVQGTGFWRAPEVLKELQKAKASERDASIWTEKVDVYSYAMTCYEVLTGHIPFDGYCKSDWKRVIDGERPHLPDYIDSRVRELVERCWHNDPSMRPTLQVIYDELNELNQ